MRIVIHDHAVTRMLERGATRDEVATAIQEGETFPARLGRTGFRRCFAYDGLWHGKRYSFKQVEVLAVREGDDWVVITVITRYF